jgi:Glycosyl hydrolase family 12
MQSDRSSPVALDGGRLRGLVHVFVKPGRARIDQVVFTLDPGTATARQVTERFVPFDFGRTNADGSAKPLDLSTVTSGPHTLTVAVRFSDRRERALSATFTVAGGGTIPSPSPTSTTAPTTPKPKPTTTTTTTTRPPTTTTTTRTTNPPPPSRSCPDPVFVTSDTNGGWSTAGYYVHNNMWNWQEGGPETLYACAHNNWYVESTQPNTTSVKTYPNVHLDINNMRGAPLSNYRTITTTFAGTGPRVGIYNVAYDVWLNGVGWGGGTTEFMVWTENFNQRPLGSVKATATFGGMAYDVWHFSNGDANVISLVAKSTMLSGSLDLKAMFDWAIARNLMPPNPTVNQIGYGVEICSTNNTKQRFTFTDFSITIA